MGPVVVARPSDVIDIRGISNEGGGCDVIDIRGVSNEGGGCDVIDIRGVNTEGGGGRQRYNRG